MIFGVGGSEERSKTRTTTTGTKNIEEKQTQQQTGTQKTTGETRQESTSRFLDPETEALLQNTIQAIAGGGGGAADLAASGIGAGQQSIDFANLLTQRAVGTGDFVQEQIAPILSEARRVGEDELGRQVTRTGQQAGSNLNSFVQLAAAEGRADLESQLAALNADLVLQGRELESRDVATAANALQTAGVSASTPQAQNVEQITSLANILRGATAETTGTAQQEQSTETEQLATALREVLETFKTTSTTRGESSGFGFNVSI